MKKLGNVFPSGFNERIRDEPKTVEMLVNDGTKFGLLQRKMEVLGMEYCTILFLK